MITPAQLERLEELARVNPIANAYWHMWQNGTITYREFLLETIFGLAAALENTEKKLIRIMTDGKIITEFHVSKEDWERAKNSPD